MRIILEADPEAWIISQKKKTLNWVCSSENKGEKRKRKSGCSWSAKKAVKNNIVWAFESKQKIEGCILSSLVQPMLQMSDVIGQ